MQVNVHMTRKVSAEMLEELQQFLTDLRQLATGQRGYIGGKTFFNVNDREEILVISSWASKEHWDKWFNNEKRKELLACVDAMLQEPTIYKVYQHLY